MHAACHQLARQARHASLAPQPGCDNSPPFLPAPAPQAEQMIVDAVRSGYFQARFDHKNNTVHFGGQEVESERVRGHIATMAKRLTR